MKVRRGGAEFRCGYLYEFNGKRYSKGFLKYLRGLALLKRTVLKDAEKISNVLEIGGGIGLLGEIMLKAEGRDYFYVDVDIPPMSYFTAEYLKMVFGEDAILDYGKSREMEVIDIEELRNEYRAIILCPWQLEKIKGKFDLFVNFTSFQEMEPEVVRNYIDLVLPRLNHFVLLMNRKFGQNVTSEKGERGVKEPIHMDHIISLFDGFDLQIRDQKVFGDKYQEMAVLSKGEEQ